MPLPQPLSLRTVALGAVSVLAPAAAAQGVQAVVLEGDDVPGVGLVTSISNLAINDAGDWIVEVDTDNADTDADAAVLRNGVLVAREGDALAAPAGATLDSFDSLNLNAAEDTVWNLFLDGTSGTTDDSGVFFGLSLLFQEGDLVTAPEVSAGTPWRGFFDVKLNEAGDALVLATIDDPAVATATDQAIVRLDLDATGALLSQTVVAKEGDVLPGQTEAVSTFATNPHQIAFNTAGQAMFFADLVGDTSVDGTIWIDGTLVAQEGSPSPLGAAWSSLSGPELDLNDAGGYVFSGRITGDSSSDTLVVKDGAKFRQEGDTLPAFSPFVLTSFGGGPILLSESDTVVWFGDWDDPDTSSDSGLFVDDTLLVQEGVTTSGGMVIAELRGIQDGYTASPDGRWLLFEGELADGREGAFRILLSGSIEPMDECFGNDGLLSVVAGSPTLGSPVTFEMSQGQVSGVFPVLAFSLNAAPTWPPCGIPVPGLGELLIGLTAPDPVLLLGGGTPWLGAPTPFNVALPATDDWIGVALHVQGVFADFGGLVPAEPLRATNGIRITIGP